MARVTLYLLVACIAGAATATTTTGAGLASTTPTTSSTLASTTATTSSTSSTSTSPVTCMAAEEYFVGVLFPGCTSHAGETCSASCASGHKLEEPRFVGTEVINATVTCLSNGTWTLDSDALHCRPLAKCALPTADTKLVVPPSCVNEEGQACEFACVDDHEVAEGETYITCTLSGEWSSPLPRCIPAVKRPSVHTDGTTGMHLALDGRHDLLFTADNRAEPVGVLAVADRMTAVDREGGALDSLESSIADDVGALSTEQSAALSSLVLATETSTVAFQAAAAGTRDTLSRGIETMNSALDEEHTELSSALSGVDARLTTGEDTLASVSTAEVAAAASLAAVDATLSSDLASEIATTAAARKTTNEKLDVVTDNVFLLAESHGDLSDSHSALTSSVVALLEDEITVMRTRALAAESVLSNGVGSVSSGVSGETTRATKTESALSGRLDQLTASVTTERNRATTRENSIDSRVTGVSNTVNSVSSRASAVSKSAYTVSIQTRSVSSAVNSVSGQDASVKSKIDTTTSRLSGLCTAVGGQWSNNKCSKISLPAQCRSHTTHDDYTRQTHYGASGRCDNSWSTRWYRLKYSGNDAKIPTSCVKMEAVREGRRHSP